MERRRLLDSHNDTWQDGIQSTVAEELAEQPASFRTLPFPGTIGFVSAIGDDETGVFLPDTVLQLTNAEWEILTYLAFREGRAVPREQILSECLGCNFGGSERTVDTHVANIRAVLGSSGWIETVRGFGYRFVSETGGA